MFDVVVVVVVDVDVDVVVVVVVIDVRDWRLPAKKIFNRVPHRMVALHVIAVKNEDILQMVADNILLLGQLKTLIISCCEMTITKKFLERLSHLKKLRFLDLQSNSRFEESCLSAIGECRQLKILQVKPLNPFVKRNDIMLGLLLTGALF